MRLLLYHECDIRGRRLLFDSNGFETISVKKPQRDVSDRDNKKCSKSTKPNNPKLPFNVIEICDDIVYKVLKDILIKILFTKCIYLYNFLLHLI